MKKKHQHKKRVITKIVSQAKMRVFLLVCDTCHETLNWNTAKFYGKNL